MAEEEKIPIETVLKDMYENENGIVARAARDYYYSYYATPEERISMDKKECRELIIGRLFLVGIITLIIYTLISNLPM